MLRWRLILGVLFIGIVIGLCWLDDWLYRTGDWPAGVVLLPIALFLAVVASHEILWLLATRDLKPLPSIVYGGNVMVVGSGVATVWFDAPGDPWLWPAAAFALVVIAAFVGEIRRYERPGTVMEPLALSVFAVAYIGLPLAFIVQMRMLGGGDWGIAAIASLVIVVKMCDIGAYTVGRLFGRHRMAPVLSPGKTWEGIIGGLVFGCAGSYLALNILLPRIVTAVPASTPSWGWLAFGILVTVAGIVGDLAESLIKRDVGRKDSSDWMPGFGGVLDLLDSVFLPAPVAYLCWICGIL